MQSEHCIKNSKNIKQKKILLFLKKIDKTCKKANLHLTQITYFVVSALVTTDHGKYMIFDIWGLAYFTKENAFHIVVKEKICQIVIYSAYILYFSY